MADRSDKAETVSPPIADAGRMAAASDEPDAAASGVTAMTSLAGDPGVDSLAAAQKPDKDLTSAEIAAIAHLYRGEVFRSTTWRTRLDATTNWSVVSLGVALSVAYASPEASALPLVFVGALIVLFLFLEARRYRYFNVWRARARWIETHFYAPMLCGASYELDSGWGPALADDYRRPDYHIGYLRAIGRRLRRNYVWIFLVQGIAFFSKAAIHPTQATTPQAFFDRMAIGAAPGVLVFALAMGVYAAIVVVTVFTWLQDRVKHGVSRSRATMG
ncbi:MAG: DUF2270 domain-containing protein [Parvularculaceae bacterium]